MTRKLRVGDKVVVLSKSVGLSYSSLFEHCEKNEYCYVTRIEGDPYNNAPNQNDYIVVWTNLSGSGDYFAPSDLRLFGEVPLKAGDNVVVDLPRDHPDWRDNGKEGVIKKVSYFWEFNETVKRDLYIVSLDKEEKKFTRDELILI